MPTLTLLHRDARQIRRRPLERLWRKVVRQRALLRRSLSDPRDVLAS